MKAYLFFIAILLLSLVGCKHTVQNKKGDTTVTNSIKYAKGFRLYNFQKLKKLEILTAFKGDEHSITYYLVPKASKIPDSLKNKNIIRTPIERIVVTSTTHIPMLELLGKEHTLVGFPQTKYISSEKTRKLIAKGTIRELGQELHINTELLIELQPEVVIGFGVNNSSKIFENIQKMGIPVLFNSDWLEETPLGRAEWLLYFGALYDVEGLANNQFKMIKDNYLTLKEQTSTIKEIPTVLSGALFQDTWHLPAGQSYVAQFIKDAKANYLWKNSNGNGSLSLSFESVYEKGVNADYWVAPGFYHTKEEMLNDSPHYAGFRSFKTGNIYTYSNTTGVTGGVIYYELATSRPDLVLQDLIKIFHPDVLQDKNFTFFKKME